MSFEFRPAKRENVSLLIGLAGGTGSGKTFTAMRIAKGLAGGKPFAVIDTEAGRAKHYADDFDFHHGDLTEPFTPSRYADAIEAADKAGYPVILIDSFSHEHAGDGGLLDMHESEYQRMGGKDSVKMTAWIKPKTEHKKMVSRLLQVRAHLILCFRAEEKIEIVKNPNTGKTEIVPKRTLTGLDGWVPVSEKTLPYELTVSLLLTAGSPGVPKPIKLPERLKPFFPLDRPVSEETGEALAKWARGDAALIADLSPTAVKAAPVAVEADADISFGNRAAGVSGHLAETLQTLTDALIAVGEEIGKREEIEEAIGKNLAAHADSPENHATWLANQIDRLKPVTT